MAAMLAMRTEAPRARPTAPGGGAELFAGKPLRPLDRIGVVVLLHRGRSLFFEGDPARHCYKVVDGAVRSCRLLADGRRHLGEFFLPGDFIALGAGDVYGFSAEAINDVTLIRYARVNIEQLMRQNPQLGREIRTVISCSLSAAQDQMMVLGRKSAAERIASFLLRMADRTTGAAQISLPMSRIDIADHLGLTVETVSRTFTYFRARGILRYDGTHEVTVKSLGLLQDLAQA